MIDIQGLIDRGIITSINIGTSAVPGGGIFCNVRSRELEGNVQGRGPTVQEAFDAAMMQMQTSLGHLHQTRPAPVTFQMPESPRVKMAETPTLRMPGF